jgi:hypothetical protein
MLICDQFLIAHSKWSPDRLILSKQSVGTAVLLVMMLSFMVNVSSYIICC